MQALQHCEMELALKWSTSALNCSASVLGTPVEHAEHDGKGGGGGGVGYTYFTVRLYNGNVSNGVLSVMFFPPALVSVSTAVKTFTHTVPVGSGGK